VSTPFFITVNGDDELAPGVLNQFVAKYRDGSLAAGRVLAHCGRMRYGASWASGRELSLPRPDWRGEFFRCPLLTPACFFSTDVVRELGGFDETLRIAADLELGLKGVCRGYDVAPLPMVVSRMSPGGLSAGSFSLLRETVTASERAGRAWWVGYLHVSRLAAALLFDRVRRSVTIELGS
jgi:hypothetical protein